MAPKRGPSNPVTATPESDRSAHPRLAGALLMIGVVVVLVALAFLSI